MIDFCEAIASVHCPGESLVLRELYRRLLLRRTGENGEDAAILHNLDLRIAQQRTRCFLVEIIERQCASGARHMARPGGVGAIGGAERFQCFAWRLRGNADTRRFRHSFRCAGAREGEETLWHDSLRMPKLVRAAIASASVSAQVMKRCRRSTETRDAIQVKIPPASTMLIAVRSHQAACLERTAGRPKQARPP